MSENIENQESSGEVELSPVELKAQEQGWVPKEQWEGEPEQWRPAKEFLDRGELFKKIEDQSRSLKEVRKALEDLKGHHKQVREVEYSRALAALKNQKKTALEEGDAESVINIDDQIDLVKQEQSKLKSQVETVSSEVSPEFTQWTNKNSWYETNEPMRAYADALGRSLAYKGLAPLEVLQEVERMVKQEFPNKFKNPNRDKPGAVEGSSNKGTPSRENFVLSDDERRVMRTFVRTGIMTEKQYIDELKKVRS